MNSYIRDPTLQYKLLSPSIVTLTDGSQSPHLTASIISVSLPSWGSWTPLPGRSSILGSFACQRVVRGKGGGEPQATFRPPLSSHHAQEFLDLDRMANACDCSAGGWESSRAWGQLCSQTPSKMNKNVFVDYLLDSKQKNEVMVHINGDIFQKKNHVSWLYIF